jgi:acyl-CoA synthetase (AMP-forming)/AMP-acid ligase II
VHELGSRLAGLGLTREDRVAVVLPNGPEAVAVFLAASSVAACAPLNPAYTGTELDFYLDDLRARVLVTTAACPAARDAAGRHGIPVVEAVTDAGAAGTVELAVPAGQARESGPASAGDIALVLHTSGTTSRPKIVPLSHANLAASAGNVARSLQLAPEDCCLNVMPLFHIHGLVAAVLASLSAGAGVVCTAGFDGRSFWSWLDEFDPTWYTAVPTMHQAVLGRARERGLQPGTTGLRLIRSSSAALPSPTLHGLEAAFGVPVLEAYGMTEAAHQMACNPLDGVRKPGSVGLPAGPEIAVLDDAGNPLDPGSVGEVAIRGRNVFAGYEANPEANEASFTGGWFRTGDEGHLDGDGYLFLRGRLKEIVNRGGEKISPREVDEVLLGHPAVAEAVTFAVPHPTLGEDVAAAVVLADGQQASEEEIRRYAGERVAGFKVPRRIVLLDELPKGSTGKVQRIGFAERLGLTGGDGDSAPSRPPYVPPRSGREQDVAALWSELLDTPSVGLDDDFFALGGDSIAAAEVMTTIAERGWTPVELPAGTLLLAPTVERFAGLLERSDFRFGTSILVPLRAGDPSLEPLFLVHTHEGHVLHYLPLALALTSERPVWAFEAPTTPDGEVPWARLEDMAAAYIAELHGVQPAGPYWLGGNCMGGLVAFEMARQLEEAGERVALAVLVNPSPGPRGTLTRARHRAVDLRERAALHRQRGDLLRWLGRKVRRRSAPSARARRPPPELTAAQKRFLDGMAALRDSYVPSRFGGEIAVIRAPRSGIPCSYWRRLAARVHCENLPSTPSREEHTSALAERVDALLEAQRASASNRDRRRS